MRFDAYRQWCDKIWGVDPTQIAHGGAVGMERLERKECDGMRRAICITFTGGFFEELLEAAAPDITCSIN